MKKTLEPVMIFAIIMLIVALILSIAVNLRTKADCQYLIITEEYGHTFYGPSFYDENLAEMYCEEERENQLDSVQVYYISDCKKDVDRGR